MIKTNGFRVLAMVMTTLWMVTIIPVTVVQAADFRGQGFDLSSYNGTVNWEQVAEADMDFVMIRTGERAGHRMLIPSLRQIMMVLLLPG